MSKEKPKAVTRLDVVIETWRNLKSDSVGACELEEIQRVLAVRLGDAAVQSPASIARTLADIGAPLRHPEVLDFDTVWREAHSVNSFEFGELDFRTIETAVGSVKTLDTLWDRLKEQKDAKGLASLRTLVLAIRQQLRLLSRSRKGSRQRKKVALEVEQWLGVWLQNPQIFADWLELRMNSAEFRSAFDK